MIGNNINKISLSYLNEESLIWEKEEDDDILEDIELNASNSENNIKK